MKTFLLFVLCMVGMYRVEAQDMLVSLDEVENKPVAARDAAPATVVYTWEFWSALQDYTASNYARTDEQLFGKDVACLLTLLDEKFVRKEQVIAGDPAVHTCIAKPVVYNSVKNIAKYYRQKNREKNYTFQDSETFAHVVKVALACMDDDSAGFEEVLKKTKKDAQRQIGLFQQVKLKNIYE